MLLHYVILGPYSLVQCFRNCIRWKIPFFIKGKYGVGSAHFRDFWHRDPWIWDP